MPNDVIILPEQLHCVLIWPPVLFVHSSEIFCSNLRTNYSFITECSLLFALHWHKFVKLNLAPYLNDRYVFYHRLSWPNGCLIAHMWFAIVRFYDLLDCHKISLIALQNAVSKYQSLCRRLISWICVKTCWNIGTCHNRNGQLKQTCRLFN